MDAVKDMITDYNEMMSEIRKAYATMPAKSSSGTLKDYEPLTEEQRASMSENEIKVYEEKAKQGILFADNNLRSLYERMRDVFEPSGMDSALLSKIGISSSFSSVDNSTTIGRRWRRIPTRWRISSPGAARTAAPATALCRA